VAVSGIPAPAGAHRLATGGAQQGTQRRRSEGWVRRAPLLPALVFTIIVTQLPFLFTLYYSLQSWNLVRPGSREFVGLSNYANVFTDSTFREAALNTVIITGSVVLIAMVIGVALALLLDRKFLGRGIVRTLLITPFLVTPVAAALLWKTTMFDPVFGIINFVLGPFGAGETDWVSRYPLPAVITELVWQWTPFMMLLVLAGLQSQPRETIEAARVDGASSGRLFRELTLPHLRRYIELGIVLGAIYVVNTFDAIYMMTQGGPGTASTNLPFYLYQRAFLGFDIGQAAALGVVVVVGTIIVSTVALRLIFTSFTDTEEGA
jgi:sorbitol/mannitol transport system permease protein